MMSIYTDGSCKKNKVGSYGFITVVGSDIDTCFAKRQVKTTNNQMELKAFISALQFIKKKGIGNIDIYSDSEYVVKGYNRWLDKWTSNGWKSSGGNEIANQPLWNEILKLKEDLTIRKIHPNVLWVKAHGKNKYNNFIDNLVQIVAK